MMVGARRTVKSVLDQHKNVGPGFDLLRLALACAIFFGHTRALTGHNSIAEALSALPRGSHVIEGQPVLAMASGADLLHHLRDAYHYALVPMFFALSGFLVTGSALRVKALKPFLAFRMLRIVPALTVEVTLSAILIGPFFTALPVHSYFTDPEFFRYFGNIAGFVTFNLPGVFTTNPISRIVNANLWTLPAEFYCYLLTSALIFTGVLFRRGVLLIAIVVFYRCPLRPRPDPRPEPSRV